jgi:hypothetical protein
MPEPEIRSSKSEIRMKSETRSPIAVAPNRASGFGSRLLSDFGTSDFGFQAESSRRRLLLLLATLVALWPEPAHAYLGPGAGFTIVSTFFVLFAALASAFVVLLTWPFRWVLKAVFRPKRAGVSKARRVVIVGLDGQDPELTEKWMNEGLLPNFSRLRESGAFARLGTTLPAESPVAWSSFQTGCNPGKHRIYDFLVPNRKSLMPELSSANVTAPGRTLKLGKYLIPLGKPVIAAGRKSEAFWTILGRFGIFSTVLRVPITFPAGKVRRRVALRDERAGCEGQPGHVFLFHHRLKGQTNARQRTAMPAGGHGGRSKGELPGPQNTLVKDGGELRIPFSIVTARRIGRAKLQLPDQTIDPPRE